VRVVVILTARPSWAKLEPVCRALKARPGVELQIIACASALLERYGDVSRVLTAQGYTIAERVYSVIEGNTRETAAIEGGVLQAALARTYQRLQPDVVVVCADRHEVPNAAEAAANLHIPVVHLQGGEITGSIDDKAREATTAWSDIHCVCTEEAYYRLLERGKQHVYQTGCPSIDVAKQALNDPPVTETELGGSGAPVCLTKPFLVILQHPVTSEADQALAQMHATLQGTRNHDVQRVILWPGEDAGADQISKAIRNERRAHTVRNLPPVRFLKLLTQARVLVGNSSAGIREASYLGVPVVNIGSRQQGRERASNVIDVPHDVDAIRDAIAMQLAHGPFPSSTLYGSGNAGEQIAEVIGERVCADTCA
jgi:UDP-hydrolysing UDP-N-acetyl-D-glucosamine 2-epimerase